MRSYNKPFSKLPFVFVRIYTVKHTDIRPPGLPGSIEGTTTRTGYRNFGKSAGK